jgi:periplasmic protein TonB
MNAIARGDLTRWAISAAVVVGLHAIGAATLLAWHDPVGWGESSSAIVVDLTPYAPPSGSPDDLAPSPLQQLAAAPAPQAQVEPKVEPKPEEVEAKLEPKVEPPPEKKIEVPPAPVPPVAAVPPPEAVEPPVTVHEPEAKPAPPSDTPPAPVTTAPPREHPVSPARANRWHKGIYTQIKLHQAYPAAARARGQKGVVQIAFAINRQGRVVSSRVEQASGYAALDRAALETIDKAQPFEPPPPDMAGDEFSFTVPLEFKIR